MRTVPCHVQLDAFRLETLPGNNHVSRLRSAIRSPLESLLGFPSMNDVYGRIRRTERKEPDGDWPRSIQRRALAALDVSPRCRVPT